MDEIDFEILRELLEDSRAPFSRIAKKLNLAPDTICNRYEKMKKNNSLSLNLAFDPAKLGYQAMIFLLIKIAPNYDRNEAIRLIKNIPSVFAVIEIIGEFNLFCTALVESLKGFTSVVSKVNELPAVERVDFSLSEDFTLFQPTSKEFFPIRKQER